MLLETYHAQNNADITGLGLVAPPKCLFHIANQIEKDRYTLIEQLTHLVLLKSGIY